MDFQLDTGLKFGFTCPDDHEDFQNLIAKSEPLIRSKNHHSGGSCGVDEISHSEDDENLVENDSKLDLATHIEKGFVYSFSIFLNSVFLNFEV